MLLLVLNHSFSFLQWLLLNLSRLCFCHKEINFFFDWSLTNLSFLLLLNLLNFGTCLFDHLSKLLNRISLFLHFFNLLVSLSLFLLKFNCRFVTLENFFDCHLFYGCHIILYRIYFLRLSFRFMSILQWKLLCI